MGVFGRKWTITGMAVPQILGWILMPLPQLAGISPDVTIWIFYIGRFVLGKFNYSCDETHGNSLLFHKGSRAVHTLLYQVFTLPSA